MIKVRQQELVTLYGAMMLDLCRVPGDNVSALSRRMPDGDAEGERS